VSNDQIRPSSIEGIKQLTKRLKKSCGIPHAVALNEASKAAGFENYQHARRSLEGGATVTQTPVCTENLIRV
jgi:ethanolamine utilization microcompartment shell protein EutL